MKTKEKLLLCLCHTCANQFYNSPEHIIKRVDIYQKIKDSCTYCSVRSGYDYEIITKTQENIVSTKIRRGEIYYVDLSPTIGSEQNGIRPILILQNNIGNRYSPTVIIAAITSQVGKKKLLPTHIPVYTKLLAKDSIALLEQIRTIDKSRLGTYIGTLDDDTMTQIDKALQISIGLYPNMSVQYRSNRHEFIPTKIKD